jgi:hypothetical protein
MRSDDPFRKRPGKTRPEIWASGGQRPPFDVKALATGSLVLAREGVVPILAWAARTARRVAVNVKNGAGRIPGDRLGRAARFVPSHLRVAGWIKTFGATLAHASATADRDVSRGNALVAEIEPHLWDVTTRLPEVPAGPEMPQVATGEVAPVVLSEPKAENDPLAAIRGEIGGQPLQSAPGATTGPDAPPAPPGAIATGAIQVAGYLIGWASVIAALPYGLARALWQWINGRDLKSIGRED